MAAFWRALGRFGRPGRRQFCLTRQFEFLNLQLQLFELLLDMLRLLVELLALPRFLASIPIGCNQHAADGDEIKEGDGNLKPGPPFAPGVGFRRFVWRRRFER